jgi:hypothetical protein
MVAERTPTKSVEGAPKRRISGFRSNADEHIMIARMSISDPQPRHI